MIQRLLFTVFAGLVALPGMAQDDDMYFVPTKKSNTTVATDPLPTYPIRDVDEYNRRGKIKSYYQKVGTDSVGNDIIEFHAGDGSYDTAVEDSTIAIYPGSERYYDEDESDYAYSRRMSRFDGFYASSLYDYWDPFWWYGSYGWYSPCYSRWGWHTPWYSSWYNPWYSPWYYSGWGWNYPYWGWGYWGAPAVHVSYNRGLNPSRGNGRGAGFGNSRFGNRNTATQSRNQNSRNNYGQRRNTTSRFDNQRQQWQQPAQRSNGFGNSRGGFGGSRGGGFSGGFGGGSRGGGFGSRR